MEAMRFLVMIIDWGIISPKTMYNIAPAAAERDMVIAKSPMLPINSPMIPPKSVVAPANDVRNT